MIRFGAIALCLWIAGCASFSLQKAPSVQEDAAPASPAPALPDGTVFSPVPEGEAVPSASIEGEETAFLAEELPQEQAEIIDPETLEDNLLLAGEDQAPPEDEGVTVAADEEVTFDFPVVENQKVRYYIDYYTGPGKKTFARWLERSGRYLPLMRQIFAEEGLPQDLTYLAMVESGFNNKAYSWANAVGPWQFIEGTGRGYGLENDWWHDERRDFEKSTRAAARFLKDLHKRFDGDWYLAVAAYNAGGGKISQAVQKYGTRDFWELSRHKFLQDETKNYVPKLLAMLLISKEPEKYGFSDLTYLEPLDYEVAEIPSATDLEVIASLCQVSYEELKALNPELKRWCTPPGVKNYQVRIPGGSREEFEKQYADLPPDRRANYKHHRIRKGDTLLALAKRYGIRVADIVSLNGIRDPRSLRLGTDLILPLHKDYTRLPVEEMKDDYVRTRRRTYTVRQGDSLWKISQRFDVSEKDLRVWNRLGWSNVIRPGQTLIVSAKAVGSPSGTSRGKPAASRPATYRVKAGDSLWEIARRFDMSMKELQSLNGLGDGNVIRPGQTLSILGGAVKTSQPEPPKNEGVRKIVYQVRPGDSLWTIGRKYAVAASEIMDWNNLPDDHVLRPGDKLTLLVSADHSG